MTQQPLSPEQMQTAVDAVAEHGNKADAARALGIPRGTLTNRYSAAVTAGFKPGPGKGEDPQTKIKLLEERCRALESQQHHYNREEALDAWIREQLFNMRNSSPTPPGWVHEPGRMSRSSPGTPILALGDWHAGESIDPSQVGGLNKYNTEIFHRRAKRVVDTATDLLKNHMVQPEYPGIVVLLMGDMISGDIHDELKETNDLPTMHTILDVCGVVKQSLRYLADNFGRVHVAAVVGNHGRNTQKMRAKNRTATSFDWLLYKMVEMQCNEDDRITFQIPTAADTIVRVYGHTYMITHGDQFRGGDGVIGPLGPLVRGDYKKRLRQSMVNEQYDTLVTGHFHRLITLSQLITNGSLVGYNEYAYVQNFPYEPPQQALWITHPTNGITFTLPVLADEPTDKEPTQWLSMPA